MFSGSIALRATAEITTLRGCANLIGIRIPCPSSLPPVPQARSLATTAADAPTGFPGRGRRRAVPDVDVEHGAGRAVRCGGPLLGGVVGPGHQARAVLAQVVDVLPGYPDHVVAPRARR